MRIVISGTVGIGKSTTTKNLVNVLKQKGIPVHLIDEQTVESVYFDYYYRDPSSWAFIAQLDFLLGRFKQWLTDERFRETHNDKSLITIYDRHFLDDYVFAELHTIKNAISQFNSLSYQCVYKELLEKMVKMDSRPDYFIMLKAPLDTILERLKSRGREEEKIVQIEYWKDLYFNYYERPMFQNHFRSNVKKYVEIHTENKSVDQVVEEILKIINK